VDLGTCRAGTVTVLIWIMPTTLMIRGAGRSAAQEGPADVGMEVELP